MKKVEAAGFHEVILYFNAGLKPHFLGPRVERHPLLV